MRRKMAFLILGIILITACNRDRISQYDIQADNFHGPTAVNTTGGSPIYDPNSGLLVGVEVVYIFCDPFPKALGLTHILYEAGFAADSAGFVFPANTDRYTIYVYNPYGIPVGSYSVKCFFGGWPVAGFMFDVVSRGAGTEFRAKSQVTPDTLPLDPDLILHPQ